MNWRTMLCGLAVACCLSATPGCATIVQVLRGGTGATEHGPAMFGGTRAIAATWYDVFHGVSVQEPTLVIISIDWVTSFVGDVLIFPWAIVNDLILESGPMDIEAFHEMWE